MQRATLRTQLAVLMLLALLATTGCAPLGTNPGAPGGRAAPGGGLAAGGLLGQPAAPGAPAAPGSTSPAAPAPLAGPVSGALPAPASTSSTTLADGTVLTADQIPGIDPASLIGDVKIRVVGDATRIAHVIVICHGDHPAFYDNLLDDEQIGAKLQASGVGAVFAFPRGTAAEWPGFENGQNGATILAIFQYLLSKTSPDAACQFGGLSGAGNVENAFLSVVNGGGAEDFATRNLKCITDHDSLCRSIEPLKNNYVQVLQARTGLRANFIHGEKYGELNTNTTAQHQEVGQRLEPGFTLARSQPDPVSILGGRVRFWSGPDHFDCLRGQIWKAYFTQ